MHRLARRPEGEGRIQRISFPPFFGRDQRKGVRVQGWIAPAGSNDDAHFRSKRNCNKDKTKVMANKAIPAALASPISNSTNAVS